MRERVLKNPTLAAAFDTSGTLKQDFVARMDADAAAAADTTYDRAYRSSTLSAAEIDGVVQKANGQSQNKKSPAEGEVMYNLNKTSNMSWQTQIQGALNNTGAINRSDTLTVGDPSAFLQSKGVAQKPLAIPLSVVTKAKGGKDISHSIEKKNLEKLQAGIQNAPIVIDNPSRNALVYITDIRQDGKPVLVSFQKDVDFDGDQVHKATSIHLQMDVDSMLKALPKDATVYTKNKSEFEAAVGVTNNLRSLSARIEFTDNIIPQNLEKSSPAVQENSGDMQKSGTVRAFTGQLTEAQSKKNAELRNLMGVIGQRSGGKIKYFLAENTGENGFIDMENGIIGIDVSTLESGKAVEQLVKGEVAAELWQKTAIHETDHATEGTASHVLLADHLVSNDSVFAQAVSDFIERGYFGEDLGAATQKLNTLLKKEKSGAKLTQQEQKELDTAYGEIAAIAAENVLGNADFIKRLVKGEPSRAEKILGKIVRIKNALTGNSEANAQAAFIRKAEKLYLDAIAELGGTYRDGKIHLANREEDESVVENGETVIEMAENVSDDGETISEKEKSPAEGEVKWSRAHVQDFQKRIDAWDGKTEGFSFVMGETPSYLSNIEISGKRIGKKQVRIDATKVKSIMNDHSEMTIDVIKELPNLLNDPILVLDSKTVQGRLVLLGEVYAKGKPVMMALEINPTTRRGNSTYVDVIKVASAYTRSNTQNMINSSNIRFVNENKSRVDDWLKVNRLQLPLPNIQSDSANNSISQNGKKSTPATQEISGEIKFSRKASTDGQAAKDHADRNYGKIYTKKDAREIISAALAEHLTFADEGVFGNLVGKSRTEAIEVLWRGLNSAEEGQRAGLALDMADFIIENAVAEDLYDDGDNTEQLERLKILRGYMHKLDLSAIKAEIEYKLGKKNSAALVWGAHYSTKSRRHLASAFCFMLRLRRFPARAGGYISAVPCRSRPRP